MSQRNKQRLRLAALALGSGLSLAAALPPFGWWPLAFVGVALLDRLIADRPAGSRFRRSFWAGVAMLAPTFLWMAAFTPPGYVIAVLVYSAMLGLTLMLVPPAAPARWLALPGALLLWDAVRGRWPFGGVPISTLALGQIDSPLVPVVRAGGPLLLNLVVGSTGVALAALAVRRWRPVALGAAVVVVALVLGAVAPRSHNVGTLKVAIVQGGGQQGTTIDEVPPSVVFARHVEASAAVPQGLDMVLWPEDVVEVDGRLENTPQGDEVAAIAQRLHTTVIVGAVEDEGPTQFHNAQVAFGPDGKVVDRYEKVRRVPFGEFTPLRSLLEKLGGSAVRKTDAIAGTNPAILVTGVGTFGVSISWEIWFADRARAAARAGGEVLLNPTNGASFQGPIVQSQQLASTRMRAMETDRWAMQAAPTGYSAIVTPDGTVVSRTKISEQRVVVGTVERRQGTTWAVRVGDWPALIIGFALLALAQLAARRPRSTVPHD